MKLGQVPQVKPTRRTNSASVIMVIKKDPQPQTQLSKSPPAPQENSNPQKNRPPSGSPKKPPPIERIHLRDRVKRVVRLAEAKKPIDKIHEDQSSVFTYAIASFLLSYCSRWRKSRDASDGFGFFVRFARGALVFGATDSCQCDAWFRLLGQAHSGRSGFGGFEQSGLSGNGKRGSQ